MGIAESARKKPRRAAARFHGGAGVARLDNGGDGGDDAGQDNDADNSAQRFFYRVWHDALLWFQRFAACFCDVLSFEDGRLGER